ncbi:hypothetical protein ACOMHN_000920 [Nucella lapillus]
MSGKRTASSPLSDDSEKRPCLHVESSVVDFESEPDPDATIINPDFLSSSVVSDINAMASSDSESGSTIREARVPRVYVNDDLTKTRAEMATTARASKKRGKVADTWTRDWPCSSSSYYNQTPTRCSNLDSNMPTGL